MTRSNVEKLFPLDNQIESDDSAEARIAERFEVLEELVKSCISGNIRSLVISGSPGVGKSFGVLRALEEYDPDGDTYTVIKGYTKSTGLLKTLYNYRHPGNIIVFDDIDNIFNDDVALNLLKAVADSSERRRVSWLSEYKMLDDETGEIIPKHFDFDGTIIFLTNLDFQAMVDRKHKFAPHLDALMSRSLYLDLTMKTRRDCLIRIRQVIENGLLGDMDIEGQADVLTFCETYVDQMRELSLRSVIKLGGLRVSNEKWERIARITLLK